MAEDALNKAMRRGLLEKRPCVTQDLHLHGFMPDNNVGRLHIYGTHASDIKAMIRVRPGWARILHSRLPYTEAELRWICREEMPFKLEDLLARRTRALFLDAAASLEMAPDAANIMAEEMGFDEQWKKAEVEEYAKLVENYIC
jgi:glycerol-3-phosphate dehydrogenase